MPNPLNIFHGHAVATDQIQTLAAPSDTSSTVILTINGKDLEFDFWDLATIVTAWTASNIPEFKEIKAVADGNNLKLTSSKPFVLTVSLGGDVITDERQIISIGQSSGGTFTLTFDGQTTSAISRTASAATVEAALKALSNIGASDVDVTGDQGGPWTVQFTGTLVDTDVAEITLNPANLTGGGSVLIETLTEGSGGTNAAQTMAYNPQNDAAYPSHTGFTITYDGQTTGTISTTPTASEIQTALEALSNISVGDVEVNGGGTLTFQNDAGCYLFNILFKGNLAGTDCPLMTGNKAANVQTFYGNDGTGGSNTYWPRGGQSIGSECYTIDLSGASAGTFTLSVGGQTTSSLAYDANGGEILTALNALTTVGSGNTVCPLTGTEQVHYLTFYSSKANVDVSDMTINTSGLTGTGTLTKIQDGGLNAINEVQSVEVANADAGTFKLTYDGQTTASIDYDADSAAVETALEALSNISVGDVDVNGSGTSADPFEVEFKANLGGMNVDQMSADSSTLNNHGYTITTDLEGGEVFTPALTQDSTGPDYFNDPDNWSLGRVPNSGDDIVLEKPDCPILHGLKQLGSFTANVSTDVITCTNHSFVDDQIVRVSTDGTLPTGLVIDTDYYVINADRFAGTFQLSTTEGGSAVNITGSGTGTHYVGVRLNSLEIMNRHNKPIGLSDRNENNANTYEEYRERYLTIGILPAGDKKVTIGSGSGSGSGQMKLDFGVDDVDVKVLNTGGSTEASVPALVLNIRNSGAELDVDDGSVGVAYGSDESYILDGLKQQEGYLEMGEGTLHGFLDRTGGEFKSRLMTMAANAYIINR